jgi:exportin-5
VAHALNPGSPESQSAVQWIHQFQNNASQVEDSMFAVLQLVNEPLANHLSPHYKLFACNSLEKLIEVGWYSLSGDMREDVKRNLESLLTDSSLSENFLSSALSRCFVEVMQREWPQKWPNLMTLMLSMPKNTSVLHVLLQLGEDVGIHFKPKNPARRRDILNTMNQSIPQIMEYLWDCLQSGHSHICNLSLRTLTAYLEWIPIESQLIRLLFHILSLPCSPGNNPIIQSKVMACDCLISILSRKKMKDAEVEALSVLFMNENLSILFNLLR